MFTLKYAYESKKHNFRAIIKAKPGFMFLMPDGIGQAKVLDLKGLAKDFVQGWMHKKGGPYRIIKKGKRKYIF